MSSTALVAEGRPRRPAKQEADIEDVSGEKRQGEALADVFWALLNSGEFYLNH